MLSRQRAFALLAVILVIVTALVSDATPVEAHAIVVRMEPPDGAALTVAPKQVRMWFSEPVALNLTQLELVDGDGRRVPVNAHSDARSLALAVRGFTASSEVLVVVDLPALTPNVYRLTWRALSNNDLHKTSGSMVFGVQRPADRMAAPAVAPAPQMLEVALRWLNFGAMAALIGSLAIALVTLPTATNDHQPRSSGGDATWLVIHARRRLLRIALWAGLLTLILGGALLLDQALAADSAEGAAGVVTIWQIIGGTSYGVYWILRQSVVAALIMTILPQGSGSRVQGPGDRLLIPDPRSPIPRAIPGALVLALVVTQALQSHATAFSTFSLARVVADALHMLAASLWVGGLLALAVAVVPLLRRGPEAATLGWAVLRRFSGLAAVSLAILLATGLYASGQQVATLDALLRTLYGQALLLKVGLGFCVALIGLCNAIILHPRLAGRHWLLHRLAHWSPLEPRHLARTVLVETSGALTVLLLAALLSATQPARGPAFDPPVEKTLPLAVTTRADDLVITLAVKPNRPGQNFVNLGVFNTRRPAPAPIKRVAVQLIAPGQPRRTISLSATPLDGGRYQVAGDAIDTPGDWRMAVTVSRAGLADTTTTVPWTVLPAIQITERQPVLISNHPLAPTLTAAAIIVALLAGIAVIWLKWGRGLFRHLALPRLPGLGLRLSRKKE